MSDVLPHFAVMNASTVLFVESYISLKRESIFAWAITSPPFVKIKFFGIIILTYIACRKSKKVPKKKKIFLF
jgi:hypothetical protein